MKEWKTIVLLFLAALVFRVLHYLLFANELVVGNDQMQNIMLARQFADGNFYGVLDIYWTPLYPILIGIVTYFIDSLVLPSIIISIVAGSLAAPITYYLVKQSYDKREAVIAAVIAVFFPHLLNSVFGIGTENIYLLWLIAAVITGWRGLKRDSAVDFFATGVLVGLAYLTRPEGFGYLAFFSVVLVCKALWQRKLITRNLATQIAGLLLGFALLATPYILYLRSATGTWTISGKAATNMMAGKYSERALQENNEIDAPPPGIETETGKALLRAIVYNLVQFHKEIPYLIPSLLLIFVALGLFGRPWDKERLAREAYLALFCLVTIFGYALSVVQARYFYVLLPICIGWMARGIFQSEQWFRDSIRSLMSDKGLWFVNRKSFVILSIVLVYLYVLPVNFFMRPRDKAWQGNAYEERDAGLWIKENGKPSPTIFSASRRPVFYAEGNQLAPETTDASAILLQLRDCKLDYIVLGERSLKRNPFLTGIAENLRKMTEFEVIYEKQEHPDYEIAIFKSRLCNTPQN